METLNPETFLEFDKHKLMVPIVDESVGLNGFIAIHREHTPYPSLGATRLWMYTSPEKALRDAFRLSRLMSYKSALAGLPYGGAKGVLISPPGGVPNRKALFQAYAREVNKLEGKFVTGTDLGLSDIDLSVMRWESTHIIGEGVNAGYFTALGVFLCIQLVFTQLFGTSELSERTFAIQGIGKTGFELLALLYNAGARKVYIADLDWNKLSEAQKKFPAIMAIDVAEIHKQEVDIFSPCALGGILNFKTIPELHTKAIVGSANNQLATSADGDLLHERGIIYVPDYLANAGGLMSVVDQYENKQHEDARILERIKTIPKTLASVLQTSATQKKPTYSVADDLARILIEDSRI